MGNVNNTTRWILSIIQLEQKDTNNCTRVNCPPLAFAFASTTFHDNKCILYAFKLQTFIYKSNQHVQLLRQVQWYLVTQCPHVLVIDEPK